MKKNFCFIIILFLLSSCFGGRSMPSNFYNLISIENNNIKFKSKNKLTVGIELAIIPAYLDRQEIITLGNSETELNISEFNRWAEPLSNSIQRVVSNNISEYLKNSTIRPVNVFRKSFDYTVVIYIVKFEGKLNNKAYLESWYSIYNKNGKNILNQKTEFNIDIGNDYNDLVKKESILISKLSEEIAKILSNF